MRTIKLIQFLLLSLLIVCGGACSKKDKGITGINPDENFAVMPYVTGWVDTHGNPADVTGVFITITKVNELGHTVDPGGITGANVQVNGMVINDAGSGAYTLTPAGTVIPSGTSVFVKIVIDKNTYTATGTMPERGERVELSVSGGAYSESVLALRRD